MEESDIQWTHHTFNPWIGCTMVDKECVLCYAFATNRWLHAGKNWGKGAPRVPNSETEWKKPREANEKLEGTGRRERVFCASWADVFDKEVDDKPWRNRLWDLIRKTPCLDWLILTKRPLFIPNRLPQDWGDGYENVWLGTSVGHPDSTHRITELLQVPAKFHFVSAEPLIKPFKIAPALEGRKYPLDWCIFGGESGIGARACEIEWIKAGLDECRELGITPFVKQFGQNPFLDRRPLRLVDSHGGDMNEWTEDFRVREWPDEVNVSKLEVAGV